MDEEQVDIETQRRLDESAHDRLSAKQRRDLEGLPLALCDLSDQELIAKGADAAGRLKGLREAFMATDEDSRDEYVVTLLVGEYLWRRITAMIADECERRRTGAAPRAKGLN